MKESREEIKTRIINDLKDRGTIAVSWLQKVYGIGFSLAKEIYEKSVKTIYENNLRMTSERLAMGLPKDRAEALLEEANKVIANGGAQRMVIATVIAEMLKKKRINYWVSGNLASSYLAYELKIHELDCFKHGIRPEACHGMFFDKPYSLDFRVSYQDHSRVIDCIERMFKGRLLYDFVVLSNGRKCIRPSTRHYVVDSSIKADVEAVDVGDKHYENCLNRDLARGSKEKVITINIFVSWDSETIAETTRRIEDRFLSTGKIKKRGIRFLVDPTKKESKELLNQLLDCSGEDYRGRIFTPGKETNLVGEIVSATKPKTLKDFAKIYAAACGTCVWTNNQDVLFKGKNRSIDLLIGSRDDVFDFLVKKGIGTSEALGIMDSVGKGRGIDDCYKDVVGDEFSKIFNRMKYLYPRGHVLQLINNVISQLFFKECYPLEFYATRLEKGDIYKLIDDRLLSSGIKGLKKYQNELQNEYDDLDDKQKKYDAAGVQIGSKIELTILFDYMLEAGIKVLKPNLYKSDSESVLIDYENKRLLLPLYALPISWGAAKGIVSEREKQPFSSFEDLRRRTGLSADSVEDSINRGLKIER